MGSDQPCPVWSPDLNRGAESCHDWQSWPTPWVMRLWTGHTRHPCPVAPGLAACQRTHYLAESESWNSRLRS